MICLLNLWTSNFLMNTTGELIRISRDHHLWGEIQRLDLAFFPRPWKAQDWLELNLDMHGLWAWVVDDRVIGFALLATPPDETAHLLKILVHPDKQGIGESRIFWAALKSEMARFYKKIYLEVEQSNKRAQGFYLSVGFIEIRRVKSFYSDGAGALLMQLTL